MTRIGAALTVLVLAGCTSGGYKRSHTPEPSPVSAGATITVGTNQHTVTMRAGQSRGMYLAPSGYFTWDAVQQSTPGVVRLSNVRGGYPAQGYSATVTAIRAGTVQLQTQSDIACLHAKPACLPAQQTYRVTVIVS